MPPTGRSQRDESERKLWNGSNWSIVRRYNKFLNCQHIVLRVEYLLELHLKITRYWTQLWKNVDRLCTIFDDLFFSNNWRRFIPSATGHNEHKEPESPTLSLSLSFLNLSAYFTLSAHIPSLSLYNLSLTLPYFHCCLCISLLIWHILSYFSSLCLYYQKSHLFLPSFSPLCLSVSLFSSLLVCLFVFVLSHTLYLLIN